jgi:hypothetical protein
MSAAPGKTRVEIGAKEIAFGHSPGDPPEMPMPLFEASLIIGQEGIGKHASYQIEYGDWKS